MKQNADILDLSIIHTFSNLFEMAGAHSMTGVIQTSTAGQ